MIMTNTYQEKPIKILPPWRHSLSCISFQDTRLQFSPFSLCLLFFAFFDPSPPPPRLSSSLFNLEIEQPSQTSSVSCSSQPINLKSSVRDARPEQRTPGILWLPRISHGCLVHTARDKLENASFICTFRPTVHTNPPKEVTIQAGGIWKHQLHGRYFEIRRFFKHKRALIIWAPTRLFNSSL